MIYLDTKYKDGDGNQWHEFSVWHKQKVKCQCGRLVHVGFIKGNIEPIKIDAKWYVHTLALQPYELIGKEYRCRACIAIIEDDGTISYFDRHGKIRQLSGNEKPFQCFWCAKPIKKSGQRFCCPDCKSKYWTHYFWAEARENRLMLDDYKCQKCESTKKLEVHHIKPMPVGENYGWNVLNVPENLITLCQKCHGKTRRIESEG